MGWLIVITIANWLHSSDIPFVLMSAAKWLYQPMSLPIIFDRLARGTICQGLSVYPPTDYTTAMPYHVMPPSLFLQVVNAMVNGPDKWIFSCAKISIHSRFS